MNEPTDQLVAIPDEVAFTRSDDFIRSRIFTIRGVQVMLAPDLADMYHVETRIFNQAVKRNLQRFPSTFRFQLTKEELDEVITICDNPDRLRFSPQRPYAFTEQGIAMLSGVLNGDVAIGVSIRIMNIFVAMRKTLATIAPVMARIAETERMQLEEKTARLADQARNEERFDIIFKAMDGDDFPPQKVFYEGRHYEAYSFARKLVRKATKSIVLVDGYCDEATGLVTNKVYTDGKGPTYTYTPEGKLATRTWARGIVTTYSYDDNGSMTNTVYSDGTPTISLFYNRAGRQIEAHDAAGVTTFASGQTVP